MKRKLFLVGQIVEVLKQAELGLPVADLIRELGISEQTFSAWKTQYAGLGSDQVREFAQLFEENARLKELLVNLSLDNAVLQDILSKKFPARPDKARLSPAGGALLRPDLPTATSLEFLRSLPVRGQLFVAHEG